LSSALRSIPRRLAVGRANDGKIERASDDERSVAPYGRRVSESKEHAMNDTTPRAGWLGRYAALAGAGSAVLTFVAYLVIGSNPDSDAAASKVAAYYSAHHTHVYIAGTLLMYAAVLFALFGTAAWSRIRATDLHPAFAGAILVATAVATVSDLADASGWYLLGDLGGKTTVSAATIQGLHVSVAAADMPAAAGLGIFLAVAGVGGLLGRAFPRWVAWPALALGILELVPTPGQIGFIAGLATLLWMIVAGAGMFRNAQPHSSGSRSPSAALAGRA
jgi:hypothetical protein